MARYPVPERDLQAMGLSEPAKQLFRALGGIDFTAEASVETATHKLPITIAGRKFYLLLVEEP